MFVIKMIIILFVTAITSLIILGGIIYAIRNYLASNKVDVGIFFFCDEKEFNEDTEALLQK